MKFWSEKYDKDVEAKQRELAVLKDAKAKDLEKLQELTKLVCIRIQIYVYLAKLPHVKLPKTNLMFSTQKINCQVIYICWHDILEFSIEKKMFMDT